MFIGRVYNSMRNGTYPLMFIGRVYNRTTKKMLFSVNPRSSTPKNSNCMATLHLTNPPSKTDQTS